MQKQYVHFNTSADPISTKWYLKPLTMLLSAPFLWKHKTTITREGMEGIKPPYMLLCNHNAFFDFMVAAKAIFPNNANYIVAVDGFVGFPGLKWLMLRVGCICKRKFTNDLRLVRQLSKIVEKGNVVCFYPEARYSLCGTTAVLPSSLGKLCKMLNVPIATLMCHGHHVNSPAWNKHSRHVKGTEAELKLIFTAEEVATLSADEINARLVEEFQYDDFAWQKQRGIITKYKRRAENLHKILYQCPRCGTEFEMSSKGTKLTCNHCGKSWTMTTLSELVADDGETEFSHIPDWYEWERANVRKEVEAGTYSSGVLPVTVRTLPNVRHFMLGEGTLVHDMEGFHVHGKDKDGDAFNEEVPVPARYSCHVEYNYHRYGDCLDVSTLTDTWFLAPHDCRFSLTKIALATEELYYAHRRSIGRECKPGLA